MRCRAVNLVDDCLQAEEQYVRCDMRIGTCQSPQRITASADRASDVHIHNKPSEGDRTQSMGMVGRD